MTDTTMTGPHGLQAPAGVRRSEKDLARVREIAASGSDRPVLMVNMNRYKAEAGYPDGALYQAYRAALARLLPRVGAKVLWESPVHGQMVGDMAVHEVLAVWYPSHQAFLDMPGAEGAEENYRLRAEVVDQALIQRCDGETPPLDG